MADIENKANPTPDSPPVSADDPTVLKVERKNGSSGSASREVLVFQAGPAELPNIIQFLNFSRSSGQLEVDPHTMLGERGIVCFRDGDAYYARLGTKRGFEAVSEMLAFKRADASFLPGRGVQAQNIHTPTRDVVLQLAVEADRQIRETQLNGEEESGDEDFLVTQQPASRIVVRDYSSKEAIDQVQEKKGNRLVALMLFLAAVAVVANAVWVAGEIKDKFVQRGLAKEAARDSAKEEEEAHIREKKIAGMLLDAVNAYKKSDLAAALERVEAVLVLDPGNQRGLDLQQRIVKGQKLERLVPLRKQAVALVQELDGLSQLSVFQAQSLKARNTAAQANILFESDDLSGAIAEYRAFITTAKTILENKKTYDRAVETRQTLLAERQQAEKQQAQTFSPDLYKQAVDLEQQGKRKFDSGSYEEALNLWREASEIHRQAMTEAKASAGLQAARDQFNRLLEGMDQQVLTTFADQEWQEISQQRRRAERLTRAGQAQEAIEIWRKMSRQLVPAWQEAKQNESAAMYRQKMATARKAIEDADWAGAMKALESIIAFEAFKDDPEAKKLWEQVSYSYLSEQLSQLQAAGRWKELRAIAKKIIETRPADADAGAALALAEDKLLPRIQFVLHHNESPVTNYEIQATPPDAVPDGPFTYLLKPDREYTFSLHFPPKNNTYFEPVHYSYGPPEPGKHTARINVRLISTPAFGSAWDVPGTGIGLKPIASGTFSMGSQTRGHERPVRTVGISKPFWIAQTEITNGQYRLFQADTQYDGSKHCRKNYLKHFSEETDVPSGNNYPIVYISWKNAMAFCEWLTDREKAGNRLPDGYVYRLPTEAEWEYSCRAGTTEDFSGNPSELAWHGNRSSNNAEVGQLQPNPWDIYDMHGNVWELCLDWYAPYPDAETGTDPTGPERGLFKVIRGGSWRDSMEQCRSSWRSQIPSNEARNNVGFRIVLAPGQ